MSLPNFPDKAGEEALLTPQAYRAYLERLGRGPDFAPPEGVILCYQGSLMSHIRERHGSRPCKGDYAFLEIIPEGGGKLAVAGRFGIGAPAATSVLEDIIALGCRRFVSVGTAGSLQRHVDIGHVVLCEEALRDEGTSYHYLAPDRPARPSSMMLGRLRKALETRGATYHAGASWTIDAPYRETVAEARRYQGEGILAVEMEAAALFAVAEHRGVDLGAMFTISDSLAELVWQPEFHADAVQLGLETLYAVAREALLGPDEAAESSKDSS